MDNVIKRRETMPISNFSRRLRRKIIGTRTKVPLLSGRYSQYINFDNAASTPPCKRGYQKSKDFLKWYSNVHRGAGFKSQLATEIYDQVHNLIAQFIGANITENSVILTKNTTESINLLANSLNLSKDDIVLTSLMEHHSNLLPWRQTATVKYINLTKEGRLNLNDLKAKLKKYQDQIKLVAVTAASNVTGYLTPIYKIAKLAHHYGAEILVDGAQLVPHRPVAIKDSSSPSRIDYFVFSAHKMYAPFGTGVLVGPKETFNQRPPAYSGGGTIKAVTQDDVLWADLPAKYEAGTPNIVGAVSLGATIKFFQQLSWEQLVAHENKLLKYTVNQLRKIPEVTLYGEMTRKVTSRQVGVIPFNIKEIPHTLTAAILANEFGIGVRNGCFCAHLYLHQLLGTSPEKIEEFKRRLKNDNHRGKPGMVRVSLGCYNTITEINKLLKAIKIIIQKKKSGANLTKNYHFNPRTGEYVPDKQIDYDDFFRL
jgi:selenocysteine lyase/cysteine desulfurase